MLNKSKKNSKEEMLYISYDGIMEPIGVSQILMYLENLSIRYKINLLTYEKINDLNNFEKVNFFEKKIKNLDIFWKKKRYHKFNRNLSTIFDVINGIISCVYLISKKNIKIIHIRSYLPGVIVYLFIVFLNIKLVFDMRGFWADEKVDRAGLSKKTLAYKFLKFIEKKLLFRSNAIICLTNESIDILQKKYPKLSKHKFYCIPTCVDTELFKPLNSNIKPKNRIIFAYLGSTDTAYNIKPVLKLFLYTLKKNKNCELRIFGKKNDKLINSLNDLNVPSQNYSIFFVDRKDLTSNLNECNIGVFFSKNNFSIKASFPTKIGEFLACGLPIICNSFNNDISNLINNNNIGLICDFENFNNDHLYNKMLNLKNSNEISNNCRNISKKFLSLKSGVSKYNLIYEKI